MTKLEQFVALAVFRQAATFCTKMFKNRRGN